MEGKASVKADWFWHVHQSHIYKRIKNKYTDEQTGNFNKLFSLKLNIEIIVQGDLEKRTDVQAGSQWFGAS